MSSRAGLRFFAQSAVRQSKFTTFRQSINSFRQTFKRHQTSATNPAAAEAGSKNAFQRLWESEVGIKTVHFWAPIMKWGVVLAGASDFFRPAEKLSLTQNMALIATGSIWTRWCFVIRPQNIFLAAVNFALFIVGTIQTSRILAYRASQKDSTEAAIKDLAADVKDTAKSAKNEVKKEL